MNETDVRVAVEIDTRREIMKKGMDMNMNILQIYGVNTVQNPKLQNMCCMGSLGVVWLIFELYVCTCTCSSLVGLCFFFRAIVLKVLQAAWNKNIEVREEHDWLDIEGAVTKGNKNGN